MFEKCPGQDSRNIKIENITCNICGYEIEIFSDEMKIRCPKCRNIACRKLLPSCVNWCKSAKDCVGYEKWKVFKGG